MSSPALVKYINLLPQNISDNIILKVNPKNVHFLRENFLVDPKIDEQYSKQWYSNILNMIDQQNSKQWYSNISNMKTKPLNPKEKELFKKWISTVDEFQLEKIMNELNLIISKDVNFFATKLFVKILELKYFDLFDRLFENWVLIKKDHKLTPDDFDNNQIILQAAFNSKNYENLERVIQSLGKNLTADNYYQASILMYTKPDPEYLMKYLKLVEKNSDEEVYQELLGNISEMTDEVIWQLDEEEIEDATAETINKLKIILNSIENLKNKRDHKPDDFDNNQITLQTAFNSKNYENLERVIQSLGKNLTADDYYQASILMYTKPDPEYLMKYLKLVEKNSDKNVYQELLGNISEMTDEVIWQLDEEEIEDATAKTINKLKIILNSIEKLKNKI